MTNRNVTIWVMGVVLCLASSPVVAVIEFKDGGTHDIDYGIADDVWVDYQAPGVETTVNLLDGGYLPSSYELRGYEDSHLNIYGGSVGGILWTYNNSQLYISGGSVDYLAPRDNSRVYVSGGSVNDFDADNNSRVYVSGGSVDYLYAFSTSEVYFSGGSVDVYLSAIDNSQVYISGGLIDGELYASVHSQVDFSGGSVASDLMLRHYAVLTINGSGFAVDGQPFGYGELTSIHGGYPWDDPSRHLTGTLFNGDPLDNDFYIGHDAKIVLTPGPSTPPVADADGPYSIYVGDTLTLNASGSTDDDNDIVSYMWDLDDVESFETDAGGQAIFDVNYTSLQSLGLLINYTYTIHLKVTDSEGQSDVNDSTLTIVPKPAMEVVVDIKPGSCPNPVNVKSSGVLPVAILGTDDYDITTIDPTSIRLAGVEPLRSGYEDVAGPVSDSNDCNCTEDGPDGFLDLTLKFKTQRIVEAIGDVNDGDVLTLELTGVLFGERPIEGADCILIRGRHKPINPADINKDGVVDMADFAIFAQNWLQSSIVED